MSYLFNGSRGMLIFSLQYIQYVYPKAIPLCLPCSMVYGPANHRPDECSALWYPPPRGVKREMVNSLNKNHFHEGREQKVRWRNG